MKKQNPEEIEKSKKPTEKKQQSQETSVEKGKMLAGNRLGVLHMEENKEQTEKNSVAEDGQIKPDLLARNSRVITGSTQEEQFLQEVEDNFNIENFSTSRTPTITVLNSEEQLEDIVGETKQPNQEQKQNEQNLYKTDELYSQPRALDFAEDEHEFSLHRRGRTAKMPTMGDNINSPSQPDYTANLDRNEERTSGFSLRRKSKEVDRKYEAR